MAPETLKAIVSRGGFDFFSIHGNTARWGAMQWSISSPIFREIMIDCAMHRRTAKVFLAKLFPKQDYGSGRSAMRQRKEVVQWLYGCGGSPEWFWSESAATRMPEFGSDPDIIDLQARYVYMEHGSRIDADLKVFGIRPSMNLCRSLVDISISRGHESVTKHLIFAFNRARSCDPDLILSYLRT